MIAFIYHYNTQTVRKERQKRVPHPVCRSPEGYALSLAYNIATPPAPAKLKQPFLATAATAGIHAMVTEASNFFLIYPAIPFIKLID